jgi:hypothetical protein
MPEPLFEYVGMELHGYVVSNREERQEIEVVEETWLPWYEPSANCDLPRP